MTEAMSATLQQLNGDSGLIEFGVRVPASNVTTERQVPFGIDVTNTSASAISVTNPYEGLSYQLIDPSGTPVQVDAPPSSAKVHVKLDPAAKLAYLDVVSARHATTNISVDDAIGAATVELEPGDTLSLDLMITSSIDPSDRSTLDGVATGEYQLVVMARTVATLGNDRYPMQFRTVDGLPITVS